MAEAKSGASKPAASRRRSSSSQKSRAPSRSSSTKAKAKSGKPKASSESKPRVAAKAVQGTAVAAEETAKDAGRTVGRAAKSARVPLLAGGAALAGVAGGVALGARHAHRHKGVGRMSAEDFAKAAKKVGSFSSQVGEFATELQHAREASNGNAHRSPVEVVLQGLTSRRPRD